MAMRKLPIGIQSFEKIREGDYLYVDKTRYIWDLVQSGSVYFLSRPRRFGKSLFISTLEAYFRGKKKLFKGLAIEELENGRGEDAWQEYPVIHFALSSGEFNAENGLANILSGILRNYAEQYQISDFYYRESDTLPVRFKNLIEQMNKVCGKPVVVLVDEYDKPLLETMIVNEEQEEKNRQLYKSFFSALKDEDAYLKFVFFTGVTKFSKVSIFSDLNQLRDISLWDKVSGICGITEDELRENFGPEVKNMAAAQEMTEQECYERLAEEYDGYHFSPEGIGVYNPFSLLSAFAEEDFGRYWFGTGTPTFVVKKLLGSDFTAEQLTDGVEATESSITNYRADDTDPIPLLYQAGYLTIAAFNRRFRLYTLKFPNSEVKYGFMESLVPEILGRKDAESPLSSAQMILALERGDIDSFMTRVESMFAGIPYAEGQGPVYEREWRNEVYVILTMLGEFAQCEVHSATGRADCVVKTGNGRPVTKGSGSSVPGFIYIFEFKVDKSADEALRQIDEKGYAEPYKADPRKLFRVGVSFSSEKRNITEWKVVPENGEE